MAKSSKSLARQESKKEKKEKRKNFRKPLTKDPDVGKRLNTLRRTLGITQKEFGELIKMPSTSISAYERNLKSPLLNVLARIQKEFNANITWIVSGKGKMFVGDPPKLSLRALEYESSDVKGIEEEAGDEQKSLRQRFQGNSSSFIPVQESQWVPRTQVLVCVHCDFGVTVPESQKHKFCPECSHALIQYCYQCGGGIAFANAKFCSQCQVSLKKERTLSGPSYTEETQTKNTGDQI